MFFVFSKGFLFSNLLPEPTQFPLAGEAGDRKGFPTHVVKGFVIDEVLFLNLGGEEEKQRSVTSHESHDRSFHPLPV